jgi:hypothetical protein
LQHADVLRANGIVTSSVGQKRRAVADAEQNNVKEEENDGGSTDTTAKIKALEVGSLLDYQEERTLTLTLLGGTRFSP